MRDFISAGLTVLSALALVACGDGEESASGDPATNDLGPVHVHGLGVNPADGALFVATHTGMFRIPEGEEEATRVGGNFQDTMGFTIVGPNHFLGSGHPDLRDDLPPYLGLIESKDAGKAWNPVSLLGKADFHVLEAAGDRVYGYGSNFETREEQFLISSDAGRSWEEIGPPESVLSLAIDPEDSDHIVISGSGTLFESTDAGGTWRPLSGGPGLLSWSESGTLYAMTADGVVSASDAAGSAWQEVGEAGGEPAAFEADQSDRLYVALHDGSIKQSADGGRTWTLRSTP